ncbi:hypothetical protein CRUP_008179 [Coryphaenoides rupestris]|nr:hypothetical protein CRUP_008179 [Coryphaenoides rupestris]
MRPIVVVVLLCLVGATLMSTTVQASAIVQPSTTVQANGVGPDMCCFSFYKRPVKMDRLHSYVITDTRCPTFTTMNQVQICADPNARWVQRAMRVLDERNRVGPEMCCLSFDGQSLKRDKLHSYFLTDTRCPTLTTMGQIQICVDPNTPWVQRAMRYLDERS